MFVHTIMETNLSPTEAEGGPADWSQLLHGLLADRKDDTFPTEISFPSKCRWTLKFPLSNLNQSSHEVAKKLSSQLTKFIASFFG